MSPVVTIPSQPIAESDSIRGRVEPAGYRLLVHVPDLPSQMKEWANLHMPDERRAAEEAARIMATVVAVGPDAYKDKTKFPTGPWCKQGDTIVMRAYAGIRFTVRKHEYRLINDDTVLAVVAEDAVDEISRL